MGKKPKKKNIEIMPQTAQLELKTFAATVTVSSPYMRAAELILTTLRHELQLHRAPISILAPFLLHYFACEALAKLLQGVGKKPQPVPEKALDNKKGVHLGGLTAAIKRYGLAQDSGLLHRVFDTARVGVEKRSARMLRNKIVHELSHRDVNEVHKRGIALVQDMQWFIGEIEQAVKLRKLF